MSNSKLTIPENLKWSERMVLSAIHRRKNTLAYGKSEKGIWDYTTGLLLLGILKVWEKTSNNIYFNYVKNIIDSFINDNGTINGYKVEEYNIDNINCGKTLFPLYKVTNDGKYKKAIFLLMKQLETHPRIEQGGFWHKKIYPYQMWLDGIYMGLPFYAEFAKTFNKPEGFDDITNQIILIEKHTKDNKTGLLYHGWDEKKIQVWADKNTGCSRNFWGRAIGWFVIGVIDVLDFLPADHENRSVIIDILKNTMNAVINFMDKATGLWYQVLDQGNREGNYLESSASCMFVYALSKGLRKGFFNDEYEKIILKSFKGIIEHLIEIESNGIINLKNICQVAGLGGKDKRDGSYEYYISEPKVTNDRKGIGSFIFAANEIEKILNP